ncbi:THAP domain-containing protein 11-like [Strigops habroptila]|uniref:THAP domain-containing protein 11-like n=1 Tax=Strigops habroptila TaxID=2489341 RepID=UPI0011D02527|nr:THAP domain-containing protein 11-like [Strigops habroptila]
MPGFTCCVPGCYNNSHRDKALHFYTFPKDKELRRLWLKNVSRAGVSGCFSTFQPTTGHRVCSEHFQGGRKSYLVRVPTIFPLRGVNERKAQRAARRPRPAAAAQGPAAEDVKPIDLTVQVELGPEATAGPGPGRLLPLAEAGEEDPLEGGPPDHSYSLSSGTTSEELLRKLNEQRDIIALLEVKMKEMKGSIRRLRLAEAQLREEIREKDRLLHAASAGTRKRHGL